MLESANKEIIDGDYVALQSVLILRPYDVQTDERVNITGVGFHRSTSKTALYFIHSLPEDLAVQLNLYIEDCFQFPFLFIFSDKKGGPLSPQSVNRAIHRAATRAGVEKFIKINGELEPQPINSIHFRCCSRPQ